MKLNSVKLAPKLFAVVALMATVIVAVAAVSYLSLTRIEDGNRAMQEASSA